MPLFLFILGLIVGSFLNVQILRSGFSERGSARSRCMACDAAICWYDLLPVVSYARLSGRCRSCGSALPLQYPLVELACGASFMLAYLSLPPAASLWGVAAFGALLCFIAALIATTVYDLKHFLIPAQFSLALAAAAAAASAFQGLAAGSYLPLVESAEGGALLFAFFAIIVVATRGRGMGMGDAYIAGAIGVLLGPVSGLEAVMTGIWAGTAVALLMLSLSSLSRRTRLSAFMPRVTMKTELPLVPFLAFGAAVALFTSFSPLSLLMPVSDLITQHL